MNEEKEWIQIDTLMEVQKVQKKDDKFEELLQRDIESKVYHIPDAFGNADFLPGHDLDMMLNRLIDQHETLFSHLVRLKIICLWKAQGGMSQGKPILGKVQAATGLVGFFSEADFVIWLAADHLREAVAEEKIIEACLFERLCSLQWNPKDGIIKIVGSDFSGFTESLKLYGSWRMDLKKAHETFGQLSLFTLVH